MADFPDGDDPPEDGGGTKASGLRDYVYGPILTTIRNRAESVDETLETMLDRVDSINQTVATIASKITGDPRREFAPRPSEFPHNFEVEVPADTGVNSAVTAEFEPDYDGVIRQVDIEFPNGVQQAVGVQLRNAGGVRWIPRGGVRQLAGGDPEESFYVQANDRTISATLNVEVDADTPIVAEFINSDPNNSHLIEIVVNIEERVVGEA